MTLPASHFLPAPKLPAARRGLPGQGPLAVLAGLLRAGLILPALLMVARPVSAYENTYPRTEAGIVEVKTVPPSLALQAEGEGAYFSSRNSVFGTLFRYISRHDVKMTVPVEADVVDANRMRFFVGSTDQEKQLPSAAGVEVMPMPERQVLAVGLRGSYTQQRFDEGRAQLEEWLGAHPEWKAAGAPYAVYWNGPFVPGFAKRSEVHLPIAPSEGAAN